MLAQLFAFLQQNPETLTHGGGFAWLSYQLFRIERRMAAHAKRLHALEEIHPELRPARRVQLQGNRA